MLILFPSQVYQPRSQEVTVTVTATKAMEVSVTRGDCSISVGSGEYGTEIVAAESQQINLKFTTKSGYAETGDFEFLVNGERSFFLYCTEDDPTEYLDSYYRGKSFLDTVTATDGGAINYQADNSLDFISPDGETFSLDLTDLHPEAELSKNISLMLDNRSNTLYRIDVDNKIAIRTVDLGSPALGVAVAKMPGAGSQKITWVTLQDGKVLGLDDSDKIVHRLTVAGAASGIDTSLDGRLVAIADSKANQIHFHEFMGDIGWKHTILPGMGYPYDIFVDAQKNIWITSKLGSTMQVYPFGSKISIDIEIGSGQKTIKQLNDRTLAIVCTESNEIVAVDTRTKTVKERIPFRLPMDIAVQGKTVFISDVDSKIYKMDRTNLSDASGPIELYQPASPTVYAMETQKDGTLIVAKMYSNTPKMIRTPNYLVDQFELDKPLRIYTSKPYQSGAIKLSGQERPIKVVVPEGLPIKTLITRRGEVVSTDVAEHDDDFSFTYTLPQEVEASEVITFPVLAGNTLAYFESKVKVIVNELKPFRFQNWMMTDLSVPYKSNIVTIGGLDEEAQVEFVIVKGHEKLQLLVNGNIPDAGAPILVKNLDTLQFVGDFDEEDFDETHDFLDYDSLFFQASCEDLDLSWQVLLVENLPGETVTIPATKGLPIESINWRLGTWNEISVYDSSFNRTKTIEVLKSVQTGLAPAQPFIGTDYFSKQVFIIDAADDSVCFVADLLNSGPYAAAKVGERIFVTFPDISRIAEFDAELNLVEMRQVGYMPYGIVEHDGKFVVAGFDGSLHYYKADGTPDGEALFVSGALTTVEKHNGKLYVIDFANNKLKTIVNRLVGQSYLVGGNPTSVAFNGDTALVVNNYDNSVTTISLTSGVSETKELMRPVHEAVWFGGSWRIADMKSSFIASGFDTDPAINSVDTDKQNTYLWPVSSLKLYAAHFTDEFSNILEVRKYATSEKFEEQVDVSIRKVLTSNAATFNYMSRPQKVSVPQGIGYKLVHNGVESNEIVVVNTGDTVAVRVNTPIYRNAKQEILLAGAGNYSEPFMFTTIANYLPDYIKFDPVFGKLPGEWAESNTPIVSGVSDDVVIDVTISDQDCIVYVNGAIVKYAGHKTSFKLTNGDAISLAWETELAEIFTKRITLYSVKAEEIFATWDIYILPLAGVADPGLFVNWSMLRNSRRMEVLTHEFETHLANKAAPHVLKETVLKALREGTVDYATNKFFHNWSGYESYGAHMQLSAAHLSAIINTTPSSFYQNRTHEVVENKVWHAERFEPIFVENKSWSFGRDAIFVENKSWSFGRDAIFVENKSWDISRDIVFVENKSWAFGRDAIFVENKSWDIGREISLVENSAWAVQRERADFMRSVQQFVIERFADGIFTPKSLFGTWSALTNTTASSFFSRPTYDYIERSFDLVSPEYKHNDNDLLLYRANYIRQDADWYAVQDANYIRQDATWFEKVSSGYENLDWSNREFSARPYTNAPEYTQVSPSYYCDRGTLTGFTLDTVHYDLADVSIGRMRWKKEDYSVPEFVDIVHVNYAIRSFDHVGVEFTSYSWQDFVLEAQYVQHTPASWQLNLKTITHTFNTHCTEHIPVSYAENNYYGLKTYEVFEAINFYINARDFSISSSVNSVAEARIAELLLLTPPVIFKLPAIGYFKLPVQYIEVVIPFGMFVDVPVQHIMDQSATQPRERGSFDEIELEVYIDNDKDFEEGLLQKYQLPDGTWMYYFVNRLKYGDCVLHKYIVEMGVVRGG